MTENITVQSVWKGVHILSADTILQRITYERTCHISSRYQVRQVTTTARQNTHILPISSREIVVTEAHYNRQCYRDYTRYPSVFSCHIVSFYNTWFLAELGGAPHYLCVLVDGHLNCLINWKTSKWFLDSQPYCETPVRSLLGDLSGDCSSVQNKLVGTGHKSHSHGRSTKGSTSKLRTGADPSSLL